MLHCEFVVLPQVCVDEMANMPGGGRCSEKAVGAGRT
jgi:hypothetical protein